ncbi:MFS transporter [Rhodopila sp.]|uniref:MFS transporter n=1 Tax=Rhodopila sp. TaxID=2480087 RepID=UPI003D09D528
MTFDREARQFRLLTVHCVLWSLAMSMAGGFVGAYLLRQGFSLATTIVIYAILLLVRFAIRAVMLPVIRRVGMRRAILLGAGIAALQFLPLIGAEQPLWLAVWILIVAAGECVYWPVCHAANAVCGGGGRRGRQLAHRQMARTAASVVGPVVGGILLTRIGPAAEFGIATAFCLLSAAPLWWMREIDLGRVPTFCQSLAAADLVGLCAFAGDGWMSAGTGIAWALILFSTLGSSYDALGWASTAAAGAGALAGLGCGVAIDRGHRHLLSHGVTAALLIGVLMRVASGWAPWVAFAANTVGAAVSGLYYPILMSVVYDRAKRSGSAYQFHLSTEAGWDSGAILGCLVAAAVAWTGVPAPLAVLPSVLGIVVIHRCVRAECKTVAVEKQRMVIVSVVPGDTASHDEKVLPQAA